MKLFLDTSSLIKLYYQEDGTDKLDRVFGEYIIEEIFLSEISITEFYSAIFKKVRTNDLSLQNASDILSSFANDQAKFSFIPINSRIISLSKELLEKYGVLGLRALDALQLASFFPPEMISIWRFLMIFCLIRFLNLTKSTLRYNFYA